MTLLGEMKRLRQQKKKGYAGMMFKSQSCWNQQALALPFFLQHVPDSEKCLYSKARTGGPCENKRDGVSAS